MSADLVGALAVSTTQSDLRGWAPAQVTAVDTSGQRLTVLLNGGSARVPYGAGATYTVNDTVAVLLDSAAGPLVLMKLATAPAPPSGLAAPAAPTGLASFTALIRPTWSGTWRTGSGWDRWNAGRYGGRSDLYQGNDYGSGVLVGLATYGDQILGLGATAITAISAHVVLSNGSGTPTLQGSPSGTQPAGAPAISGATASGFGDVLLASTTCESFRTGALKGLALVGGTYVAVRGTSLADGMALTVTYTKPV